MLAKVRIGEGNAHFDLALLIGGAKKIQVMLCNFLVLLINLHSGKRNQHLGLSAWLPGSAGTCGQGHGTVWTWDCILL